MATPQTKIFGTLAFGIMYIDTITKDASIEILTKRFGEIDISGQSFDFTFTNYYDDEMGTNLKKIFICFKKKIKIQDLPKIKLFTNSLEKKLSKGKNRIINIDPGYITKDQVIVASCKHRPHRIYLSKGVYAHIMFFFTKNDVISFKWTFPDYLSQKEFFIAARKKLLAENN